MVTSKPVITATPEQFAAIVKRFLERGDNTPVGVCLEIRREHVQPDTQHTSDCFWFAVMELLK